MIADMLSLGTAQLGDDLYPQIPEIEAERILRTAWHVGIRYYDTAQSYGLSEERCGRYLPNDAKIITKLHPDACEEPLNRIEQRIMHSFDVLRRPFIWGLLLHRERMLLRGDLMNLLWRLKDGGHIGHVGVSAESNERIRLTIPKQMDVAQFPASITRAPHIGHHFVRSVFERGAAKDRVAAIVEARERFPGAVLVIGADSAEQVRENARMVEDACRERVV